MVGAARYLADDEDPLSCRQCARSDTLPRFEDQREPTDLPGPDGAVSSLDDDRSGGERLDRSALERYGSRPDRKSTRLNSSHQIISYAVFCLKKKKKNIPTFAGGEHGLSIRPRIGQILPLGLHDGEALPIAGNRLSTIRRVGTLDDTVRSRYP